MKKEKSLENELFYIGLAALPTAAVFYLLYQYLLRQVLPPVPCFFSTVLGIYCPGCGGTRALEALFHGKVLLSLWYHPFILYAAVIYTGFMVTQGLHRLGVRKVQGMKFHYWYLWAGAGIIGVNFVVKNILRLCFGIMM